MLMRHRRVLQWIVSAMVIAMGAQDCRAADPMQGAAVAVHQYSIPAGPLDQVLIRFATASKIDLVFDADALRRHQSTGLTGRYAVLDGIRKLLDGTEYQVVDMRDGGYLIRHRSLAGERAEVPQTLPMVIVTGRASRYLGSTGTDTPFGRANLGILGNVDGMDAPLSTRRFDAEAIKDSQAYSVADVVENDASVRSVSKPGGILDAFTIRGLPYSNGNFGEIAFDGVYGVASNYRVATGYVERIELIKGPTTLLYGMSPVGSLGGAINIVPKRAGVDDVTEFGVDYGSVAQVGTSVDVSRRFGGDRAFGVRFNGGYRAGDTGLDNQHRNAGSGALSLDYRDSRLQASLDIIGQHETISAPFRLVHIVPGIAVPEAPDGHRNISQSWESSRINDGSALARVAYDVNERVQLFAHVGGGQTRVARVFAITPTIINEAGDVSVFDTNYRFEVARASAEAGARWDFGTGPLKHRLALSVSGYRDQLNRGLVNSDVTSITNLFRPVALPSQTIPEPASVPKVSATYLSGLSVVDTVTAMDDAVRFTAGLRFQRIRSDNFDPDGTVIAHYDKGAVSPMLGIVFRPSQAISLYANRVEGLSKGETAPTNASNAGEVLAPYRSTQYEVGVKFASGTTAASLSAFQIGKISGVMNGSRFSADGEQRNRGIEFGVREEIVPGVRVNASAMWIDATISGSSAFSGKTPIGVPSWQANLGGEWDPRWVSGLTLSSNLVFTGAQYVDASNTQRIPSWTRWDLGVRYRLTDGQYPATLRLAIRNVLNRSGWVAVDAYGGLAQADPRTVLASVSIGF
ncbi:TonB-dependent receptor [Cupriavidus pauculus]|uniref:TonB-dependent receptor n=1 Tax=Cupriavidus pauculus TaxID=82633 RepID=UPI001EE1ED31|nr:TonB-dependent receptor [Cupriavidus pauculus]GJG98389.1 TonB-dependent receptor [Cupriavidus pauculus]